MTIPGDPYIYSVKYKIGSRQKSLLTLRNENWGPILESMLAPCLSCRKPVVLKVIFYVSPNSYAQVTDEELSNEKTPAVQPYELCEYLLSLMELLYGVLISSYKQIVKLEIEKYYSSNPRTVFNFLRWDEYVRAITLEDSLHTKAEDHSEAQPADVLQPVGEVYGKDARVRAQPPRLRASALRKPATSRRALRHAYRKECSEEDVSPTNDSGEAA